MKNISQIDWARLAVLIDGEGCITIHGTAKYKGRKSKQSRIMLCNTDPRIPLWIKNTFLCGTIRTRKMKSAKHNTKYEWELVGPKASLILTGCLKYFLIKRDQAELAIAHQATKSRKYCHSGVPKEVLAQREKFETNLVLLKKSRMTLDEATNATAVA